MVSWFPNGCRHCRSLMFHLHLHISSKEILKTVKTFFGTRFSAVGTSQYSNLDLETQNFGTCLRLVRRLHMFQRQKQTWEFGYKLRLWCQGLLRGGREWAFRIDDFPAYRDRIAMKELFMPPFIFLCPHFSLSSLPLLKHNDGQMLSSLQIFYWA